MQFNVYHMPFLSAYYKTKQNFQRKYADFIISIVTM